MKITFIALAICSFLFSCSSYNKLTFKKVETTKADYNYNSIDNAKYSDEEKFIAQLDNSSQSMNPSANESIKITELHPSSTKEDNSNRYGLIQNVSSLANESPSPTVIKKIVKTKIPPSKHLKRFNTIHWTIIGLLGIVLISIVLAFVTWEISIFFFPMLISFIAAYVLSFIQRTEAVSKSIPVDEQDQRFSRRLILSKVISIAGSIILALFGLLLILVAIALA